MSGPHTSWLFLATASVLVPTPGPDTVLILSRILASGAWPGLATLAGTQAGHVIHAVLAGVGVSTVILLFPVAFTALKVTGIASLLYLAVAAWRAPATLTLDPSMAGTPGRPRRYVVQGLASNLCNSRMIAFLLALFPQFVRPGHGSLALQGLVPGATLAVMAVVWIGLMVALVGRFRNGVARNPVFLKRANHLAAATFLGLACRLAAEQRR